MPNLMHMQYTLLCNKPAQANKQTLEKVGANLRVFTKGGGGGGGAKLKKLLILRPKLGV